MIALEFAPVQTTGAFRSVDFAQYLPNHGFEPHVLTIEPEQACQIFNAPRNDEMLAKLPSSVQIHHVQTASSVRPESKGRQLIRLLTTLDDRFSPDFVIRCCKNWSNYAALVSKQSTLAPPHSVLLG